MTYSVHLLCSASWFAPLVGAFVAPSTPDAFRTYLVGDWVVQKRLSFREGGISGTFAGSATFMELGNGGTSPSFVLAYNESGEFAPTQTSLEARTTKNALLYEFSSDSAQVYFDARPDSQSERLRSARFLYEMFSNSPGVLAVEQYIDGEDEYAGNLEIQARDAFLTTWRVRGPYQDGEILSLFRRQPPIVV